MTPDDLMITGSLTKKLFKDIPTPTVEEEQENLAVLQATESGRIITHAFMITDHQHALSAPPAMVYTQAYTHIDTHTH